MPTYQNRTRMTFFFLSGSLHRLANSDGLGNHIANGGGRSLGGSRGLLDGLGGGGLDGLGGGGRGFLLGNGGRGSNLLGLLLGPTSLAHLALEPGQETTGAGNGRGGSLRGLGILRVGLDLLSGLLVLDETEEAGLPLLLGAGDGGLGSGCLLSRGGSSLLSRSGLGGTLFGGGGLSSGGRSDSSLGGRALVTLAEE